MLYRSTSQPAKDVSPAAAAGDTEDITALADAGRAEAGREVGWPNELHVVALCSLADAAS